MSRHGYRSWIAIAAVSAAIAAAAACAPTTARAYVRVGPPARVVEVRSVAPGPGFVWIEGYHRWDGRAYYWVPGHWDRTPRPRAVWVPGYWAHDRHGYFWVDGHWR